jgi:hypothetical protein
MSSRKKSQHENGRDDRIIPPRGGLCQIRLRRSVTEDQRLTERDTSVDTLDPQERAELCEVESAWPELPHAVRDAILAIVRNSRKIAAGVECSKKSSPADIFPPSNSTGSDKTRSQLPGQSKGGR